jgi:hypothetical protein
VPSGARLRSRRVRSGGRIVAQDRGSGRDRLVGELGAASGAGPLGVGGDAPGDERGKPRAYYHVRPKSSARVRDISQWLRRAAAEGKSDSLPRSEDAALEMTS